MGAKVANGSRRVEGTQERLQIAVEQEHHCPAELLVRMPITVATNGSEWHGMVEAFDLCGHSFAQRCYAWAIDNERCCTVLKHYPIRTAEDAVRSWLEKRSPISAPKTFWWKLFSRNGLPDGARAHEHRLNARPW